MFSTSKYRIQSLSPTVVVASLFGAVLFAGAAPAPAQVVLLGVGNPPSNVICGPIIGLSDNNDNCANVDNASGLGFGNNNQITIDGSGANFTVPLTLSNTNFQASGLQAFSGTTTFNSTTSFVGPSVTFSTGTTFNNAADFNAAITTSGITNTGNLSTTGINAVDALISNVTLGASLTLLGGANVNMGGNVVHGVAAGVANTDAVNVGQLNAATAGISSNVTALQTTVATQATQITAIQAVNTTQSSQISALQAAQDLVDDRVDALFDLRGTDRRDMKQGVASAMAMASAPMPSEPGRVAYAVNGATFRGEYAVGGSVSYRLPGARSFSVNAGFSFAGNKNNGARIGIAGEF